jgi:hypothetical protein
MKLIKSQYTKRQQLGHNILCVASLRLYTILRTVAEEYVWRLNSNTIVATKFLKKLLPLPPKLLFAHDYSSK